MYKKYTSNWIAYCYAGITFLSVPLSAFNLIEPYRRIAEGSHNRALYRSAVQVASVLAKTEAEEKKKLLNLIDGIDTLSKNAQDNNPQALDQLIGLIENHVIPIQLPPNTIVPPENATDEQIQAFQKELIQFVPAQEYSAQLVAGMPPYKYYASQENRGDRIKPNMNQKGWPCRGSQTNATVLNDCITYSQQAAMRLNHLKKEIAIFDKGIDFLNLPRDIYRQKYEKIQARLEEIDREQTVTDSTIIAEENVDAKARQQRLQQRLVRSKEIVQKEEKELKDVLDALEPFSDTEINDQKQELLKLKAEHIKHVNELQHGLQELGSIALRVQDKIYKPWLKDLEQWSHMVRHTLNTTKDMNALAPFDNEPKKALERVSCTNAQAQEKLTLIKQSKAKEELYKSMIQDVFTRKKEIEYDKNTQYEYGYIDAKALSLLDMEQNTRLKEILKGSFVREKNKGELTTKKEDLSGIFRQKSLELHPDKISGPTEKAIRKEKFPQLHNACDYTLKGDPQSLEEKEKEKALLAGDVSRIFRKKSFLVHPDTVSDPAEKIIRKEKFTELNNAYDYIIDTLKGNSQFLKKKEKARQVLAIEQQLPHKLKTLKQCYYNERSEQREMIQDYNSSVYPSFTTLPGSPKMSADFLRMDRKQEEVIKKLVILKTLAHIIRINSDTLD